jgi:integrase
MSTRFSDRFLQSIKPPPAGERPVELWDDVIRGLGFRVGVSGTRTFHVMTRCNGRQVRHVIGPYPAVKLKDARDEAGEIIRQARKGIDPREQRRQARREAERAQRDSFAAIVDDFIEKYAKPRNRRWADTARTFNVNVIPAWGKRPIASITRRDVIDLLEKIDKERGPYMSNRTLAAIRRLFAWAVERDVIDASPAANVKPVGKEVSRDRVLTDNELVAFWTATEGEDYPWPPFLRTLLLTAQRRSEVATMRWQDLDLDGDKPTWTIPREFVKADRAHDVPLAPEAVSMLQDLPRHEGAYVFTTGDGTVPISGFALAKIRVDAKMAEIMREAAVEVGDDPETVELPRWRFHDLRRTAATSMAQLNFPPHVVGAVLNHSPGGTHGITAIYVRFRYDDKRRQALEAWARRLEQIVTQAPPANVVPLGRRG